jgi:iron complex transport system substrate-binding protein
MPRVKAFRPHGFFESPSSLKLSHPVAQPVAFRRGRSGRRDIFLTTHTRHQRHQLAARHAFSLFAFLICAFLIFSSCSYRTKTGREQGAPSSTYDVTDEAGRRVRIPTNIDRVVSLAPNLTEIVYAVGAGKLLVGDTSYCDYPPEAKEVMKVGDTMSPNIETIVGLHPQLVLVSTASQLEAFTRQMEQHSISVYVTDPHDLEGAFYTIQNLGEILGEKEKAAQLVSDLRGRAGAVEAAVKSSKPVSVFYQVSPKPLYTAGRDSFITDVIRRAGGKSVTADVPGAWPKYSDESALASQPEAIIMASFDSMSKDGMEIADSLKKSPAAKNGRVYGINGDFLSRPGPRLVNGLEEMARKLHPDAFK